MKTINILRLYLSSQNVNSIHIDHSDCIRLDLCASLIMDLTILNCNKNKNFKGTLSKNEIVNLMIRASGIIRHLNLPESINDNNEDILLFPLKVGKKTTDQYHTTDMEIASTNLNEYFNKCLYKVNLELTPDGKSKLSKMTSELLTNAEDHSGKEKWYLIGYFKSIDEHQHECHIVICNYGKSIYESLNNDNISQKIKSGILMLTEKHRRRGFFSIKRRWSESNLWTLYALQEGVSRLRDNGENIDRGNGTVEMIEFFLELAKQGQKKMCIISGSTAILFDGKYKLHDAKIGDETRKIIAFNFKNDLGQPPDPKYIYTLKNPFNGTIVSLRFTLNDEFFDQKAVQK